MNVLIIGEFSAFAKNLAKGFHQLDGHRVVVVSDRDHFKKIEQDENAISFQEPRNLSLFSITIPKTKNFFSFVQYLKTRKYVKRFSSLFDVVFIMNVRFIRGEHEYTSPYFSIEEINKMRKKKSTVILSSCGGDLPFFKFAVDDKRFSTVYKDYSITQDPYFKKKEEIALRIVDGVIPMSYQYAEAYRLYGKGFRLLRAIQLPFDVFSVNHEHQSNSGKIVIFNGSLRATKGTVFIEDALKVISDKYKERVIIRNDRLPYSDFLKLLPQIDLYVDLCTDYDYGMSAIAAMSAGCVVFSGNEAETRKEFGVEEIPVVPISPNKEDIIEKLSYYIENPTLIREKGEKSRNYVEEYHDCRKVAQKYLNIFEDMLR